jgi:hypothetical protein
LTKSFPKVKIKVAFDWQSLPIEDVVGDLEGKLFELFESFHDPFLLLTSSPVGDLPFGLLF